MRWLLIEARDRIMPEIEADLAAFTARELLGRGIEIRTQTTIAAVTERDVTLSTQEVIPARTVAWTAGVRAHPVVARLGLPLTDAGRIEVDRFMQVAGRANVWAIGDAAAVPDPAADGRPCPPTCQHSLRQGRAVARNVAAALGTGRRRPFAYRTLGVFVDMGRHQAVASVLGLKLRGFPAWFLARTYHMLSMPGVKRRLRLVVDWTIETLFERDASELGQLGHPPSLADNGGLAEQSAGGTGPEVGVAAGLPGSSAGEDA
jgi:NADH dehydrogenase